MGWKHEGPCAATQTESSKKPEVVKCESYTDYKKCFGLYKEQIEAANNWMKEHDKAKHISAGAAFRYSGAIGGAYTWCFTGTSLGQVVTLECSCGDKLDVSDYDNW